MSTEVSAQTDAEVIELSCRQADCFEVLYDRYHRQIHRYIARRVGLDLADDLMAETFLVAFRERGRYDVTRPFARPWLYGIATRLVGQHRRTEVRRWRLIQRTGADEVADAATDRIDDRVSAQALRRELAAVIGRLPKGQRDVLLLTAAGGLSAEEIADALGVAKGTVHSR